MKTEINGKVIKCGCGSEDVTKGGNRKMTVMIDGVPKRCLVKQFWCKKCGHSFAPKGDDAVIVKVFGETGDGE
jgi:hypothetical protein